MCSCQSETQSQTQTADTSAVDEYENDSLQKSELALLDLSDINELRDTFLKDSGHVRLVALMSPTWPLCRRGFSVVRDVVESNTHENLSAYIIWLKILPADDRSQAEELSIQINDSRIHRFWDEKKLTGETWKMVLNINNIAWDMYFLYDSKASWEELPQFPAVWMHQHRNLPEGQGVALNTETLSKTIRDLLTQEMNWKAPFSDLPPYIDPELELDSSEGLVWQKARIFRIWTHPVCRK